MARNKTRKHDIPDTSKLCVECEFCIPSDITYSPFCAKSKTIDLVTGDEELQRARFMRNEGDCKPSGKFFKKVKKVLDN